MKKYIKIFFNQVFVQLTYKVNFITGLVSNVLSGLVAFFTWNAIYDSFSNHNIGNLSKGQMLVYIAITNISVIIFSTTEVVRLGYFVRNGKLTVHLLRPYSFLMYSLFEYIGSKVIYLIVYGGVLLISFLYNPNIEYTFFQILFLITNIIMFFMFISLVGVLGFWLIQMWPLRPIMTALYMLFAGLLFPIHLLPNFIFDILSKTPFALVGYHFTLALQNYYTVQQLKYYILLSCLWTVFFYLMYKISFKVGLKKYEGMGV